MKKFILLSVCLLAGAALSFAAVPTRTRIYEFYDFDKIQADTFFEVTVTKSDKFSVTVEFSEDVEPFLDVRKDDGVLILTTMKMKKKLKKPVAKAVVAMPYLGGISTGGTAKVSVNGDFKCVNTFWLDLNGSSKIEGLNLVAPELRLKMAGATSLDMAADVSEFECENEGASKCHFSGNVQKMDIKLFGTALFENISGDVEDLKLDTTGASSYLGESASADDVEIVMDKASVVKVCVNKTLSADLDGASKCTYFVKGDVNIKDLEVSRGATLKKERK